jgi:hypothetical protein
MVPAGAAPFEDERRRPRSTKVRTKVGENKGTKVKGTKVSGFFDDKIVLTPFTHTSKGESKGVRTL